MWGGLQRPDPVAAIKQDQKKLSLGFGPSGEKAGRRLRAAAVWQFTHLPSLKSDLEIIT